MTPAPVTFRDHAAAVALLLVMGVAFHGLLAVAGVTGIPAEARALIGVETVTAADDPFHLRSLR